jgi:hypothetical protein
MAETSNHDAKIDGVVAVINELVKLGGLFYAPLGMAYPFIMHIVSGEADKLKDGLADGTVVPDGHGGFVPGTNSRYDAKTGRFIQKPR